MSHNVASIISGTPATDAPGGRLTSTNPATGEEIAEVLLGDAGTFVAACEAAREAQREWARVPPPVRGRAIQQFGRLVEENKEALAALVTREVGKPYPESLGEVQEVIDTANFFLGEGRRLYGQTVPSEMPDKQLFTFRVPVGVAAVITAGNFPTAVPAWYLVPALLCGNAVVWKPAEYSAAIAEALAQLFLHAGFPEGVFNLVLTDGKETFAGLEQALDRGLVDKVGFTGSSAVGAEIGALTGRHLQSATLELGGKNPMVVTADADLDLAVEGALFSGFGTAGQRCTSLGTVIVDEQVHDEFLARFVKATEEAAVGDPTKDVLYGPMIHQRFLDRFESEFLPLIADHHEVHGSTGTGRITADNPRDGFVGDAEAGLFVHPTIVSGVKVDDELAEHRDVRPAGRRREVRRLGGGHRAGQPPRLRAQRRDLHHLPHQRPALPRADLGGHGLGQQLDLGRRGAPALRRQRQVGQRLAPVGHVGARPVHALAVDELGLRRQAAEGADGRRGRRRGPGLPPALSGASTRRARRSAAARRPPRAPSARAPAPTPRARRPASRRRGAAR